MAQHHGPVHLLIEPARFTTAPTSTRPATRSRGVFSWLPQHRWWGRSHTEARFRLTLIMHAPLIDGADSSRTSWTEPSFSLEVSPVRDSDRSARRRDRIRRFRRAGLPSFPSCPSGRRRRTDLRWPGHRAELPIRSPVGWQPFSKPSLCLPTSQSGHDSRSTVRSGSCPSARLTAHGGRSGHLVSSRCRRSRYGHRRPSSRDSHRAT